MSYQFTVDDTAKVFQHLLATKKEGTPVISQLRNLYTEEELTELFKFAVYHLYTQRNAIQKLETSLKRASSDATFYESLVDTLIERDELVQKERALAAVVRAYL